MLNPKIQDAFNQQINAELYSAYLYLSMAAYFESQNLPGMARWMQIQAQEELTHVMKFYDFIHQRNGRVVLSQVEGPKTEWSSPLEAFEDALAHEQKVTARIHNLVDLCLAEKDHAGHTFLQWFVTEQMEEEASAQAVVDKLKLAGDHGVARFMLNGELGQRVFTPPPPAEA